MENLSGGSHKEKIKQKFENRSELRKMVIHDKEKQGFIFDNYICNYDMLYIDFTICI